MLVLDLRRNVLESPTARHRLESPLELVLKRAYFRLEGVVETSLVLLLHHVRLHLWHHLLHAHLLLERLDESRLVHRNAVFALQLVTVVHQEGLVPSKLFLNRV